MSQGILLGLSFVLLAGFLAAGFSVGFQKPLVKEAPIPEPTASTEGGTFLRTTTPIYARPATQSPAFIERDGHTYIEQYTDNVAGSSNEYVDNSCMISGGGTAYEFLIERNGHPNGRNECRFNATELVAPALDEMSSIDFIVNATHCPSCNPPVQLGMNLRLDRTNNWIAGWSNTGCNMDVFGEICGEYGMTVKAEFTGQTLMRYRVHVFNHHPEHRPLKVLFEVKYQKFVGDPEQFCDDGTPYGQCSWQQPLYCDPDRHGLVAACEICGCPGGSPICCGSSGEGGGWCAQTSCNGGGGSPSVLKAPQELIDAWNDYCDQYPDDPLCDAMGF